LLTLFSFIFFKEFCMSVAFFSHAASSAMMIISYVDPLCATSSFITRFAFLQSELMTRRSKQYVLIVIRFWSVGGCLHLLSTQCHIFYIQSFQDWIFCPRTIPVCVCVRVRVRARVCVYNFHIFGPILLKLWPHSLNKKLRWRFSQILKILLWWRHNGFFAVFQCGTLTSLIFI